MVFKATHNRNADVETVTPGGSASATQPVAQVVTVDDEDSPSQRKMNALLAEKAKMLAAEDFDGLQTLSILLDSASSCVD